MWHFLPYLSSRMNVDIHLWLSLIRRFINSVPINLAEHRAIYNPQRDSANCIALNTLKLRHSSLLKIDIATQQLEIIFLISRYHAKGFIIKFYVLKIYARIKICNQTRLLMKITLYISYSVRGSI